jgi:hypothetical protein
MRTLYTKNGPNPTYMLCYPATLMWHYVSYMMVLGRFPSHAAVETCTSTYATSFDNTSTSDLIIYLTHINLLKT